MSPYEIVRAIAGLIFTIGLIIGLGIIARKYGILSAHGIKPLQQKRIKLVEQLWLDSKGNRICLIRLDDEEHIFAIGNNGASYVKSMPVKLDINEPSKEPVNAK